MRVVKPYMDENRQIIFIEIENKILHDMANGFILAIIIFVPLALITGGI